MSTPKDKIGPVGGLNFSAAPPIVANEDDGATIQLRDIEDELMHYRMSSEDEWKPVTITVVGTYSKRYKRAQDHQTTLAVKGGRRVKVTGDKLRTQRENLAAHCIIAWDGFFDANGSVDCTPENILDAFEKYPFILEQAEAAMDDHANFSKKS